MTEAEAKKSATPVSSFVTSWITPINSIFLVTAAVVDFLTPRLGGQKSTVFLGLLVVAFAIFFIWWFTGLKHKQGSVAHMKKAIASSVVVLGVALMLLYGKFANAQTSSNGVLADAAPNMVPMLQAKLGVISDDIRAVDTRLARMESTLNQIANPSDARLALTQRGLQYGVNGYGMALGQHDIEGVELMLKAGIAVDEPTTANNLEPMAFKLATDQHPKAVDVLKVLVKNGFDPMKKYEGRSFWDRVVQHRRSPAVAAHLINEHGALKVAANGEVWANDSFKPASKTAVDWTTDYLTSRVDSRGTVVRCYAADGLIDQDRSWLEMLRKSGVSADEFKASMQAQMKSMSQSDQARCQQLVTVVAGLG